MNQTNETNQMAADAPEAPRNEQRDTAQPWPTPQDHIRDLHDAATRFEDRAKRAEAHAERLAEALRKAQYYIVNGKSGADQRYAHKVVTEALMNWSNAQ